MLALPGQHVHGITGPCMHTVFAPTVNMPSLCVYYDTTISMWGYTGHPSTHIFSAMPAAPGPAKNLAATTMTLIQMEVAKLWPSNRNVELSAHMNENLPVLPFLFFVCFYSKQIFNPGNYVTLKIGHSEKLKESHDFFFAKQARLF